jgi:hypothetical protein
MIRSYLIDLIIGILLATATVGVRAACEVSCFTAGCWRTGQGATTTHFKVVDDNEDCLRDWNYDQDFGYVQCPVRNKMVSVREVDDSSPICTNHQAPWVNPGPRSSCGNPLGDAFDYACCPTCTIET